MSFKELNYDTQEFEDAPGADDINQFTPDELLDKMARTSYEYWHAVGQLKAVARKKLIMENTLTAVIHARRFDLLTNPKARELYEACCGDPKFRATIDFVNSIIYMEEQETMEAYNYWEAQAKSAEKYHQMLTNQLMWHQSENRRLAAELMTLESQPS